MTEQNALRLADQAIAALKRGGGNRAVWVIGDDAQRTPNTDFDVGFMLGCGAKLAGVFNSSIGRQDLCEAIVEAARG